MGHQTFVDGLDENGNKYDYESVPAGTEAKKKKFIKGMMDHEYETPGSPDRGALFSLSDHDVRPALSGGLGLGFRLSPKFEVGLETRFIWTGSDYHDNYAWRSVPDGDGGTNNVTTRGHDITNYTMFNVGYNIGKNAEEPTWYVNPVEYTYDYLLYLDKKTDFTDSDGDGVPDLWDEEEDTPKGAVVDVKGRTMDSDGDGCPDHEDPEPFSSPQFPIVDCETQWPEGLKEEEVVELIKEHAIDGWFLPSIHFALDKSQILPEDVDNLQHVGEVMTRYKNLQVDVIGHTDYRASEEYNLKLSQRRSEAAVNYLVDNYGISRSRFNIMYRGESEPIIPKANKESELFMNRRVEFKIAD
jgi:outer membrane protein OmpA-like peptidoglycan-associated protein